MLSVLSQRQCEGEDVYVFCAGTQECLRTFGYCTTGRHDVVNQQYSVTRKIDSSIYGESPAHVVLSILRIVESAPRASRANSC